LAEPHLITIIGKNGSEKHMTPEEIGRKNAAQFIENLNRSFEQLKAMANADLKATFTDLFIQQGKPPEQAERMAEIAKAGPDYERRF
jgi:hypothetical protein